MFLYLGRNEKCKLRTAIFMLIQSAKYQKAVHIGQLFEFLIHMLPQVTSASDNLLLQLNVNAINMSKWCCRIVKLDYF